MSLSGATFAVPTTEHTVKLTDLKAAGELTILLNWKVSEPIQTLSTKVRAALVGEMSSETVFATTSEHSFPITPDKDAWSKFTIPADRIASVGKLHLSISVNGATTKFDVNVS